ncbi:hypothetical protein [Pseudomonas akapageensis]|uniref:hypothetical protein n=1 Tax=Pseudomonas akapageensis TaxID=2609961 RepID=UPI0014079FB6|nr:hypothetical protein [Pseudomonas akapageensis]
MNRILNTALLIAVTVLAGCATAPGPESRPYTAEEAHELALETLNRRGLSFDDYQRLKAQLQREQPQGFGFDGMGPVNAQRAQASRDRQG